MLEIENTNLNAQWQAQYERAVANLFRLLAEADEIEMEIESQMNLIDLITSQLSPPD
jgi:hypothetical protein